jgi:uncharacterized protein (TIGR04255 family)
MLLPKRIYPDKIRESVVEVQYSSNFPFEILLGRFFNALEGAYTYTNRPIKPPALAQSGGAYPSPELRIKIGNANLFYNEKITIQLSSNKIVFTCLEAYIGWELYFPEIKGALNMLFSTGNLQTFSRVGMRYISEYSNMDLKELIKFNFSFGLPGVKSDTTAFRSEFAFKDSKVILNLSNKVPVWKQNLTNKTIEIIPTSIIDVDIISDNLNLSTLEDLLKVIDENHSKEKEVFFGMLQEEFLNSLNPQY